MRGALAAALMLASGTAQATESDWRRVATQADRERLRGWRAAWMAALKEVGSRPAVTQALLFDPDRALGGAVPPPGAYRCRMFMLGGSEAGRPDFAESVWGRCDVAAGDDSLTFARESGGQRPVGTIYADTDVRAVFLGTMVIGDETRALDYGRDARRDVAGIVERVGAARWRIVLPRPHFGSTLDVIELVPAD